MFSRAVFLVPLLYQQLFYVPQPPAVEEAPQGWQAPLNRVALRSPSRNLFVPASGGPVLVAQAPAVADTGPFTFTVTTVGSRTSGFQYQDIAYGQPPFVQRIPFTVTYAGAYKRTVNYQDLFFVPQPPPVFTIDWMPRWQGAVRIQKAFLAPASGLRYVPGEPTVDNTTNRVWPL